jgi:hypothetical protein
MIAAVKGASLHPRSASKALAQLERTPDARLQGYRLNIEPVGAGAV